MIQSKDVNYCKSSLLFRISHSHLCQFCSLFHRHNNEVGRGKGREKKKRKKKKEGGRRVGGTWTESTNKVLLSICFNCTEVWALTAFCTLSKSSWVTKIKKLYPSGCQEEPYHGPFVKIRKNKKKRGKKKEKEKKRGERKKKPQCRQSYLESSDVTATWLARSSNSACKKKEF